jgi:hypothetical protein
LLLLALAQSALGREIRKLLWQNLLLDKRCMRPPCRSILRFSDIELMAISAVIAASLTTFPPIPGAV